jgi:hypothetical protein
VIFCLYLCFLLLASSSCNLYLAPDWKYLNSTENSIPCSAFANRRVYNIYIERKKEKRARKTDR